MAQENDNKKHVNTYGPTYRQPQEGKACAMTIVYWNDMIRLQFAPELPKNLQTQSRRYDYDSGITTTITRTKAKMFYKAYQETFLHCLQNNEPKKIGITIANVNQLQLDTNIVDGEACPVLRFIPNISESDRTAKEEGIMCYEFNRGEIIEDYNWTDGNFKDILTPHFELELFMEDFNNFSQAFSMAYVHADRTVNNGATEAIMNKLNRIGEANGLDMTSRPQWSAGNGGKGSIFTKNDDTLPFGDGPSTQQNSSVQMQGVGSLDELDKALA